jgi:Tat protein secretion system quality control protein TatD with DNase activity
MVSKKILRGKVNSPKNIPIIAQYIADLLKIKAEDVARITSKNCKNLFNI